MATIFICYRREDSEGYAGWLNESLAARFGAGAIFFDVDTLHPGMDFDAVIQSTLGRTKVVLVVIGRGFFSHRLGDTGDYVRREILAGLKGKKQVIPVLVGGAELPSRSQVPRDLLPLLGKNAVTLRHSSWKGDVERLIRSLEKYLARSMPRRKAPGKPKPTVVSPRQPKGKKASPRKRAQDTPGRPKAVTEKAVPTATAPRKRARLKTSAPAGSLTKKQPLKAKPPTGAPTGSKKKASTQGSAGVPAKTTKPKGPAPRRKASPKR